MIIKQLEAYTISDNRGLTHSDVGKRPGMDHTGLIFGRAHERRIDGVAHPCGHGPADLKITCSHGITGLIKAHGDIIQPLSQICKVSDNRKDGHKLGTHGNAKLGLHCEAIHTAANTDDDISQRLGAKVDDPAQFHTGGIDIKTAHTGEPFQLLIVVITFMLHAGSQGHHGQVMGIHDIIDVTGQAE